MSARVLCVALATLLCAAACAPTERGTSARVPPSAENEASTSTGSDTSAPIAEAGTCDAAAAQGHVGKPADDATIAAARQASGATGDVRVIKPGQAVTMDYRSDRLNVEVDDKGSIVRITCG